MGLSSVREQIDVGYIDQVVLSDMQALYQESRLGRAHTRRLAVGQHDLELEEVTRALISMLLAIVSLRAQLLSLGATSSSSSR